MNNVETQLQDLRNSVQILADNLTLKGIESSPSDGLTALVAKVQMIGGGGVMLMTLANEEEREGNCYLVRNIEEMNALEDVEAGKYCLIYDYNGGNVIFTNAYIYMDNPDTEEEDLAWRILNYKLTTGADKVFKDKTFLGPDGVGTGTLWTESTWATSGKVPNEVVIKIKNALGNMTDWSNLFKDGDQEEYVLFKIMDSTNVANFSSMLEGCSNLKRLSTIKANSAVDLTNVLKGCSALEDFGGFSGLGTNFIIEKIRVPEGWSELTYVYSSTGNASTPGYQYIDTGIKASSKLKIDLKVRVSSNSYNGSLFGGRTSVSGDSADAFQLDWRTDSSNMWNWAYKTENKISKATGTYSTGTIYNITTDGNICYIKDNSGTLLQTLTASNTDAFESTQNVWLGSLNNNGAALGTVRGYYYYFRMWEDGELVRDFIPVENDELYIGFYDLVEGQFYRSIGATNFYAGGYVSTSYGVEQLDSQILDLNECPSLSHDSLMNIINGLYNIKLRTTETARIILGEINLAKLTDEEKAIATNKGWVLE